MIKHLLLSYLFIGFQLLQISHQHPCASWTERAGVQTLDGVHYLNYDSVAACQNLCISIPECNRIDVDASSIPGVVGCWIHTTPLGEVFRNPYITQYTLQWKCPTVNLALGKPTFQSSSFLYYSHPSNAVDGKRDADFMHNSCSHTDGGILNLLVPAWWAVDLEKIYAVHRVIITNRGDCCPERLRDFHIGLTDISPTFLSISLLNQVDQGKIIGTYTGSPPAGTPTNVSCNCGKTGRFLYVQQTVLEPLTICELEVYGYEPRVLPVSVSG